MLYSRYNKDYYKARKSPVPEEVTEVETVKPVVAKKKTKKKAKKKTAKKTT